MTDTPETDSLARGNHVVPTEFAQDLERERNKLREQISAKPHVCDFAKFVDVRWLHFNGRDPQLQKRMQCECGKHRWCETPSKWAVVWEDTV
jgi:hypothetical protein